MRLSNEYKSAIPIKKAKLAEISLVLKSEFAGIDNVIDEVIRSFEPWYIFPEYITKPIIINLWGMTGTGKTSLINRLVEILELGKQFVDLSSNSLIGYGGFKYMINDIFKEYHTKPCILCIDEFQHSNTINEQGLHVSKKENEGIWEFLDTGLLSYHISLSDDNDEIRTLLDFLKICLSKNIEIKNGFICSEIEKFEKLNTDYNNYIGDNNWFCNFQDDSAGRNYFCSKRYYDSMYNLGFENFKSKAEIIKFVEKQNISGIIKFLNGLLNESYRKRNIDLSKSVVFIAGNLDEAYNFSRDIDPDKDPDVFYSYSKRINVSAIKKALLKRFRPEQVARLGNNHIIYPSLNSDSYRKIIALELHKTKKKFKSSFGIDINFTPSVNDIIYRESVFPTQGARPVIMTVKQMIESLFSNVLFDLLMENDSLNKINWDYRDNEFIIKCKDNNKKNEFRYPVMLKVENERQKEDPAYAPLIAVHEAGHCIIAALTTKIIPRMVTCVSANNESAGRTDLILPDANYKTKSFIKKMIMVALGGINAEMLIFGNDNITDGSLSDLAMATELANECIKSWGMGKLPIIINSESVQTNSCFFNTNEYVDEALTLIKECRQKTVEILNRNKRLLIEMSRELTKKLRLDTDAIRDLIIRYSAEDWAQRGEFSSSEDYFGFGSILFDSKLLTD